MSVKVAFESRAGGRVARVTIDNPRRHNLLDRATLAALDPVSAREFITLVHDACVRASIDEFARAYESGEPARRIAALRGASRTRAP